MGGRATSTLDRLVDPLDDLRRAALLTALRVPVVGRALAARDSRLLLQTTLGACVSLALTVLAPGAMFVLGPLVFGVAHVAGDVRYLLVRRAPPRWWVALAVAASVALVASRLGEALAPGALPYARFEVSLAFGWAAVGGVLGAVSAGRPTRALLVAPALLFALVEALARPDAARGVFAFAHNVVGIALWAALFRRRLAFALPALLVACGGGLALASGHLLPFTHLHGAWAERLIDESLSAATPALSQRGALSLGLSFVFLQAVHYAVWLSWVPQDDLRGEGTTSFKMSLRNFRRDLGDPLCLAFVAAALAVVVGAFVSVHRTRHLYLSIATFHGYLELACAAFLIGRGRMGSPDDATPREG